MAIGFKILPADIGLPHHRVKLLLSGKIFYGWRLTSIDGNKNADRDTILLKHDDQLLSFLPVHIKTNIDSFNAELNHCKNKWKYKSLPTLKRIVREYRSKESLQRFKLLTVVHHYGAVPALQIDEIDGIKIAILNKPFGRD